MVRVRSEHAIGFLKGRFQSLKGLRINIDDETSHTFAAYWIRACIIVHAFAMQCEAEERATDEGNSDSDFELDPFIGAGLATDPSDAEINAQLLPERHYTTGRRLRAARKWREDLKQALFEALDERRRRRRRNCRVVILDSDSD